MTTLLPGTGKDWVEKKGAQKFTEYHGTNTDFDVFDPKKINSVEPW